MIVLTSIVINTLTLIILLLRKKNDLPFTSCRFGYPANHAIDTTTDKIIGPDSTYNWCCQNENRVYGNNIIHTGSGEYDLIQGPDGRLQCCRRK